MPTLIARYLPRLVLVFFAGFVAWGFIAVYTDGVMPWLALMAWFFLTLLTVPYLIYADYREVKGMINELKSARSGDVSFNSTQAISMATGKVCEKLGVPEFLVSAAIRRAESHLRKPGSAAIN